MSTYSVLHYCPVLPCYEIIENGLTLEEAEKIAKQKQKMWDLKNPYQQCCKWYVQKEE